MTGFTYKSYNFVDKDPIIDEIRTVYENSGTNYKWIAEHSGVTPNTLRAWFDGRTKRPQAATINAVLRALGYKLGVVAMEMNGLKLAPIKFDPTLPQPAPKSRSSARHVVQMHKYRKRK